jgi:hypothetical protein
VTIPLTIPVVSLAPLRMQHRDDIETKCICRGLGSLKTCDLFY